VVAELRGTPHQGWHSLKSGFPVFYRVNGRERGRVPAKKGCQPVDRIGREWCSGFPGTEERPPPSDARGRSQYGWQHRPVEGPVFPANLLFGGRASLFPPRAGERHRSCLCRTSALCIRMWSRRKAGAVPAVSGATLSAAYSMLARVPDRRDVATASRPPGLEFGGRVPRHPGNWRHRPVTTRSAPGHRPVTGR
jgi:hypothetical protein